MSIPAEQRGRSPKANGHTPFAESARAYRDTGWLGTLPLRPNAKEEPPTGFTGHGAPYPTDTEVRRWRKDHAAGNIALRLAEVPSEFLGERDDLPFCFAGNNVDGWALIGIDVDDYGGKIGAAQLRELEEQLGPLPATVVSSARWDTAPLSGTRIFLVPKDYRYVGKAAPAGHVGPKHIDILYAGLRYLVVHPSIHPNGALYEFRYGAPGSDAAPEPYDGIPPVGDVAVLPESWFNHLVTGSGADADAKSDLDLSELSDWAEAAFRDPNGQPCALLAAEVDRYIAALDDSDQHHPLNAVVWRLTMNAYEGHSGWYTALTRYLDHWWDVSLAKRDVEAMRGEITRSVGGALAKVKAKFNARQGGMSDDACAKYDCIAWARRLLKAAEKEPAYGVTTRWPRQPRQPRRPRVGRLA